MAYLSAETLRASDNGKLLLDAPARFLPDARTDVAAALSEIAREMAESTNAYVAEEETEAQDRKEIFDPKVAFKSRGGVTRLAAEASRMGRRMATRDPTYYFDINPAR